MLIKLIQPLIFFFSFILTMFSFYFIDLIGNKYKIIKPHVLIEGLLVILLFYVWIYLGNYVFK
jgi:hypothetical protein